MKALVYKISLAATLLLAGLGAVNAAPLQVSHFNPGENSIFAVSSSFISGEHEMMLVDAQFQNNDAQTLVDTIKASGKSWLRCISAIVTLTFISV